MTPRQRAEARRRILEVQKREDAQARRFLKAVLLEAGWHGLGPSAIRNIATECSIWWRSVLRAKRQLGVQSYRHRRGRRAPGLWVWVLPMEDRRPQVPPRRGARSRRGGPLSQG